MGEAGRGGKKTSPPGGDLPVNFPSVPPPPIADHSFTLQAIMEMQKSIGVMSAKVDRLIDDVKSQGGKIDELRHQASYIKGGLAVLGLLLAIATFILSSKWDGVVAAMKAIAK